MKIALIISYDGSKFNGSAKQPNCISVQGELEIVLQRLGITSKINFSGRTDKNVHATKQVVSLDIPNFWEDLKKLKIELNRLLTFSIRVRYINLAKDDFHARFSAKKREYRYIISKKELTAFNGAYLHYESNINMELLIKSSKLFLGIHDFEFFSKKGSEPKSTLREIFNIKIYEKNEFLIIKFSANSYLRSQIRMIVDFMLKISSGKLTLEDLENQLQKKKLIWRFIFQLRFL